MTNFIFISFYVPQLDVQRDTKGQKQAITKKGHVYFANLIILSLVVEICYNEI